MARNWIIVLIVVIIAALGVWYATSAHGTSPAAAQAPQQRTYNLVVQNGKIVSGPTLLTANQGDTVTMNITLDMNAEIHLHGYNKMVELKSGVPGTISFVADTAGNFPFEIEDTKTDLGALQVMPK